jgi:hypothetical protein
MPRTEKQRFYQLYFQTPGVAEAELEKDVHNAIKTTLFALSGDAPVEDPASLTMLPSEGGGLMGSLQPNHCRRGSRTVTSNFTLKSSSAPALEEV